MVGCNMFTADFDGTVVDNMSHVLPMYFIPELVNDANKKPTYSSSFSILMHQPCSLVHTFSDQIK